MEQNTKSLKVLKQRKMQLVLPILVLPFLTAIFWALGGGKMDAANSAVTQQKGFNLKLPNANLKEGLPLDKMNYYDLAAIDSAKLDELIKKDPNYLSQSFQIDSTEDSSAVTRRKERNGLNKSVYRDPNEEKVHQKLEALQKVINTPVPIPEQNKDYIKNPKSNQTAMHSNDVDRLEQMMQSMNDGQESQDPELKELGGMLESILDIQHPNRVQEKLKKASQAERGQIFTISTKEQEDPVSSLQNKTVNHTESGLNRFYSLDEPEYDDLMQNTVEAIIHETQTIVNGSIVKFRLMNDIFINGVKIVKDNFLFGTASLKGERLTINISSIRYSNSLFPVDLSVYDMDGLVGIYIPGAINRDVAKASADRSMQTLGVASLDDSWGAQAAGAGIEAAKSLLSKKVKLVKVVVKAGYKVLLHDEKQKQNNSN
ncbi:conjugative transposon protein TraM [Flavobacterium hibernum]|uniref:Conjugal transfer protein TraM n=1 Tax=Flavobacterium hibernum TaxID=37752 RepID=A0A0D0F8F5_9FLAO|nr:conjugative transposon protein TraM [Flavobacterium hibernum]KIO54337.1 conjugal transfer protein TraM [Flavobacterium hibernum]OXA88199.1 conjugative transposon protein TraM [Flavobacterium hibernum]STO10825.1 Bacteroides conjugative transposon TraM protein [Flavobacterium hibernum]